MRACVHTTHAYYACMHMHAYYACMHRSCMHIHACILCMHDMHTYITCRTYITYINIHQAGRQSPSPDPSSPPLPSPLCRHAGRQCPCVGRQAVCMHCMQAWYPCMHIHACILCMLDMHTYITCITYITYINIHQAGRRPPLPQLLPPLLPSTV